MSAKKIVSYGCTVRLQIEQFPLPFAGTFAVKLQVVSGISTVKRFLCVLSTLLVTVFLTVIQPVCTLCNFLLTLAGNCAVRLHVVSGLPTA